MFFIFNIFVFIRNEAHSYSTSDKLLYYVILNMHDMDFVTKANQSCEEKLYESGQKIDVYPRTRVLNSCFNTNTFKPKALTLEFSFDVRTSSIQDKFSDPYFPSNQGFFVYSVVLCFKFFKDALTYRVDSLFVPGIQCRHVTHPRILWTAFCGASRQVSTHFPPGN